MYKNISISTKYLFIFLVIIYYFNLKDLYYINNFCKKDFQWIFKSELFVKLAKSVDVVLLKKRICRIICCIIR